MELDELRNDLFGGKRLSPAATFCCFRALSADRGIGQPFTLRHQPTRLFTPMWGSLAAAARPLLLLLVLSQEPIETGLLPGTQQGRISFGAVLQPLGSIQGFGVTCAAAADSGWPPSAEADPFRRNQETEAERFLLSGQYDDLSVISPRSAAAIRPSLPSSSEDVGSVDGVASVDSHAHYPSLSDFQVSVSELPPAHSSAAKRARRGFAHLTGEETAREAMQGDGRKARHKAFSAGGGRAGQRREDAVRVVQQSGGVGEEVASLDPDEEAAPASRGGPGTPVWRSNKIVTRNSSLLPLKKSPRSAIGRYSRRLGRRFSRLPPPLPQSRVLPALRCFEHVHGQLTLFFNGFSRGGSVIAYDLLNELRTVSEAQMMMDVEFLVLDRVMEYYGTPTHMRVVDTTVVHELLDLSNLLPWRLPHLVASIRKLALEYQPVLRQFLDRYEPIIEALVLVKVPAGLKPLRPLIARLFNIPKEKLVLASDLRDLREHIPLKYIPREFGNAGGGGVRDGLENRMSWKIMLDEVAEKLGEDAVSPAGKELLKEFREERRRATVAADTSKTNTRHRNSRAYLREWNRTPARTPTPPELVTSDDDDDEDEDG